MELNGLFFPSPAYDWKPSDLKGKLIFIPKQQSSPQLTSARHNIQKAHTSTKSQLIAAGVTPTSRTNIPKPPHLLPTMKHPHQRTDSNPDFSPSFPFSKKLNPEQLRAIQPVKIPSTSNQKQYGTEDFSSQNSTSPGPRNVLHPSMEYNESMDEMNPNESSHSPCNQPFINHRLLTKAQRDKMNLNEYAAAYLQTEANYTSSPEETRTNLNEREKLNKSCFELIQLQHDTRNADFFFDKEPVATGAQHHHNMMSHRVLGPTQTGPQASQYSARTLLKSCGYEPKEMNEFGPGTDNDEPGPYGMFSKTYYNGNHIASKLPQSLTSREIQFNGALKRDINKQGHFNFLQSYLTQSKEEEQEDEKKAFDNLIIPTKMSKIPCLLLKPQYGSDSLILYFHANGEDINRCNTICNYLCTNLDVILLCNTDQCFGDGISWIQFV